MRAAINVRLAIRALVVTALLPLAFPLLADDQQNGYRLLELDGYKVKWGEHTLGVGASISYAFANESMRFDDARNCGDLVPMTALSGQNLPVETLEREAAAAFQVWEQAANLSFYQVDDPRDADIVLGAQGKPIGTAFANVTYKPGSQEGVRIIDQALVCLNPDQQWKVGFDGNKDVYDLRYTLIHEIGHAIGLDHPGPEGQLMGFRYTETFAELQPGDLRGIRQLYGPASDNSELAAIDSDTQPLETPATTGTSTSRSIN
ncbi:matrixin family metalloprotease [Saccharospirillum sp.]|uniref:matrixin family metalloprotease n=1 Tax=Saccharospirillum sp. TaxID=2033801 RepID=UPI0034A03DD6